MILTRLTLTNFGVFRGRHEFELRPTNEGAVLRPVVLFGGKNGAGKTTILEAIRLCLYGRGILGGRVRQADYDVYVRQRLHRSSTGTVAAGPMRTRAPPGTRTGQGCWPRRRARTTRRGRPTRVSGVPRARD
ncbi:MAG: hypothetical protein EI684_10355 [Candidatus Viridilinea halotolerans]|uniref:Nuclease SbcCD subunit C n=1 Tax=Candidatus Viridilinea halotolerans TaxID=2491704 RepID=A0A426U060_9CHLR|nr:MAG: hypothetical protein EI684_10355 [Candidatus Viridilinea halotolerans]